MEEFPNQWIFLDQSSKIWEMTRSLDNMMYPMIA